MAVPGAKPGVVLDLSKWGNDPASPAAAMQARELQGAAGQAATAARAMSSTLPLPSAHLGLARLGSAATAATAPQGVSFSQRALNFQALTCEHHPQMQQPQGSSLQPRPEFVAHAVHVGRSPQEDMAILRMAAAPGNESLSAALTALFDAWSSNPSPTALGAPCPAARPQLAAQAAQAAQQDDSADSASLLPWGCPPNNAVAASHLMPNLGDKAMNMNMNMSMNMNTDDMCMDTDGSTASMTHLRRTVLATPFSRQPLVSFVDPESPTAVAPDSPLPYMCSGNSSRCSSPVMTAHHNSPAHSWQLSSCAPRDYLYAGCFTGTFPGGASTNLFLEKNLNTTPCQLLGPSGCLNQQDSDDHSKSASSDTPAPAALRQRAHAAPAMPAMRPAAPAPAGPAEQQLMSGAAAAAAFAAMGETWTVEDIAALRQRPVHVAVQSAAPAGPAEQQLMSGAAAAAAFAAMGETWTVEDIAALRQPAHAHAAVQPAAPAAPAGQQGMSSAAAAAAFAAMGETWTEEDIAKVPRQHSGNPAGTQQPAVYCHNVLPQHQQYQEQYKGSSAARGMQLPAPCAAAAAANAQEALNTANSWTSARAAAAAPATHPGAAATQVASMHPAAAAANGATPFAAAAAANVPAGSVYAPAGLSQQTPFAAGPREFWASEATGPAQTAAMAMQPSDVPLTSLNSLGTYAQRGFSCDANGAMLPAGAFNNTGASFGGPTGLRQGSYSSRPHSSNTSRSRPAHNSSASTYGASGSRKAHKTSPTGTKASKASRPSAAPPAAFSGNALPFALAAPDAAAAAAPALGLSSRPQRKAAQIGREKIYQACLEDMAPEAAPSPCELLPYGPDSYSYSSSHQQQYSRPMRQSQGQYNQQQYGQDWQQYGHQYYGQQQYGQYGAQQDSSAVQQYGYYGHKFVAESIHSYPMSTAATAAAAAAAAAPAVPAMMLAVDDLSASAAFAAAAAAAAAAKEKRTSAGAPAGILLQPELLATPAANNSAFQTADPAGTSRYALPRISDQAGLNNSSLHVTTPQLHLHPAQGMMLCDEDHNSTHAVQGLWGHTQSFVAGHNPAAPAAAAAAVAATTGGLTVPQTTAQTTPAGAAAGAAMWVEQQTPFAAASAAVRTASMPAVQLSCQSILLTAFPRGTAPISSKAQRRHSKSNSGSTFANACKPGAFSRAASLVNSVQASAAAAAAAAVAADSAALARAPTSPPVLDLSLVASDPVQVPALLKGETAAPAAAAAAVPAAVNPVSPALTAQAAEAAAASPAYVSPVAAAVAAPAADQCVASETAAAAAAAMPAAAMPAAVTAAMAAVGVDATVGAAVRRSERVRRVAPAADTHAEQQQQQQQQMPGPAAAAAAAGPAAEAAPQVEGNKGAAAGSHKKRQAATPAGQETQASVPHCSVSTGRPSKRSK